MAEESEPLIEKPGVRFINVFLKQYKSCDPRIAVEYQAFSCKNKKVSNTHEYVRCADKRKKTHSLETVNKEQNIERTLTELGFQVSR